MIQQINDTKMEERVLESDEPLCLMFFNYGSRECNNIMPNLEAVALQFGDRMEFYKINTLENPKMADEIGIKSVPTVLIYYDGGEMARYEGSNLRELSGKITEILKKR